MGMLPGELAETWDNDAAKNAAFNTKVKAYQAFQQAHRGERPATGHMRDFLLRLPEKIVLPGDCTLSGAYKILNDVSSALWPFLETMVTPSMSVCRATAPVSFPSLPGVSPLNLCFQHAGI